MGDVIEFKQKDDLNSCCYGIDDKENFAVITNDRSIQIKSLGDGNIEVTAFGKSGIYHRKELAEFLHVSSIFLDDEKKWLPKVDLISLDY